MKIGIIEICEPNHYTAVKALALTYASNSENVITIFTLKEFESYFKFSEKNISIVFREDNNSIYEFLNSVNLLKFDRIHINTISKYYKEFSSIKWKGLILTLHNIDVWFDNSKSKQFSLLKFVLSHPSLNRSAKENFYLPIKYFFKELKRQVFRNKLTALLKLTNQKVLVYSDSQKEHLSSFFNNKNIIVFPFCIHQPSQDLSTENNLLRICIPGSVDNHRRDYLGLFDLITSNLELFKGKICIDLLGYIPKKEFYLIPKIEKLSKSGITFIFGKGFIEEAEYNYRLNSCDIILGNLNVQLNSQSKYGLTKETGVIFNMIKAGKPGIFPAHYPIPTDFKSICLIYTDNLIDQLLSLINDKYKLELLKVEAKEVMKKYEPLNLYKILSDN